MGAGEEGKDERMQTFRIAALAIILAAGLAVQGGAQDHQGYISGGGDTFTTNPGIPVVIYGRRGECHGKEAPTFAALMESKGVTQAPKHGTLSGGGTGERFSRGCNGRVPVRVIKYTSGPGFIGTDVVTFWGQDTVTINVVPAVTAQTSSSLLPIEAGVVPDQAPAQLDDGWEVAAPSQSVFDPVALAALTEEIESNGIRNVHAVIVEHAGRLVYEQYFSGRDQRWGRSIGEISFDRDSVHDLRSVTKSVTSALLGIALGGDYQNAIERPVIGYFEDLQGKFGVGVEDVTLSHVLTMTAGLEWNEMTVPYTNPENDERRLNDTTDPVGMVLGRPVRDPVGSRWYYNGGLTHVLAGLIQRITAKRLDKFAEETLFGPLGITKYEWLGSSAWSPVEPPSAASGLRMRARDLAKFGSLFLHEGVWKGQQVIPAEWVDLSTQRHVQNIPWSSDGTYGYGFMWYPGRNMGSESYRIIRAVGYGDQRIFIVPEKEIVVTVFAGNYNSFRHKSGEKVLARVMDARLSSN
jgi:CubicO group peptidase (beta-lactamase class C family)